MAGGARGVLYSQGMGMLRYEQTSFALSDRDASYLGTVITEACKEKLSFVFHLPVSGEGQDDIVSIVLGYGCQSLVQFPNADNGVEWGYVVAAMREIHDRGALSLGFFSGL